MLSLARSRSLREISKNWAARAGIIGLAATAVVGASLGSATRGEAAPTDEALVGEWLFSADSGAEVENQVAGAESAEVINADDEQWTGTSLKLVGGSKTGGGNWVELPQDLLADASSATISTEVKLDASMKNSYHFLWNIGSESTSQYWFASTRDLPRTTITNSGHDGEKNAQSSDSLDADRWYQLTSVIDGDAGQMTFYVDGREVATTATSLQPKDITDQGLNTIGRAPYPDPLFKGEVATFRVWDEALDGADVQAIADQDASLHSADHQAVAEGILANISDLKFDDSTHQLPTFGGAVTWSSDDDRIEVAGDTAHVELPEGGAESATLNATATVRGVSATSEVAVQLLPAAEDGDEYGYLMVHFIEDSAGYAEKIHLSISRGNNPEQWDILNGGEPILASNEGTTGIRDPYLTQNPDTGTWYIVATDLRVFGGDNGSDNCRDWCYWSSQGSTKLNIWQSDDLIHWSPQRQIDVPLDADGEKQVEIGMAWAPEATWEPNFYGEGEGAFVVYWSSNLYDSEDHSGDTYSRVLWAATTDFTQDTWDYGGVMIDTGGNAIDTTVLKNDDQVYRATKDNAFGDGIYMERSSDAQWWLEDASWQMIQTKIGASWSGNNPGGVEGPAGFKRNDSDHWYLYVDVIPTTGYRPMETTDLDEGWTELQSPNFHMAPSTKHGGIVSLTRAEYDAIRASDAVSVVDDIDALSFEEGISAADVAAALPEAVTVDLAYGRGQAQRDVVWDIPEEFTVGTTTVTGIVDTLGANFNDWIGDDGATNWDAANKVARSSTALEVSARIIVSEPDTISMDVAALSVELEEQDIDADYRLFVGELPTVTVTDSRDVSEIPLDVFWYTLGSASDFDGPQQLDANNLGWEPEVLQAQDFDEVFAGERVAPIILDGAGLGGSETLAMAFDSREAAGVGSPWEAEAAISLAVPADSEPGTYTSELTLSLWESPYEGSSAEDELESVTVEISAEIPDDSDEDGESEDGNTEGGNSEDGDSENGGSENGDSDGDGADDGESAAGSETDGDDAGTEGAGDDLPRTGASIAGALALAVLFLGLGLALVIRKNREGNRA